MLRRILLVDDHVATREGLMGILNSAFPGVQVSSADTVAAALKAVSQDSLDLAIVDPALSGKSGVELLQDLKEACPSLRILVYTVQRRDHFGVHALRAGADGYLGKNQSVMDLLDAITRVSQGRRYISGRLAEELANVVLNPKNGSLQHLLSQRELQVLHRLAGGRTPSEIALELHLSVKTVSTYRARLLEKLHLRTTADLIRYAVDEGILSNM